MSGDKLIVLIHGSWSRGEQMAAARGEFESRNYVVHTPTLRHHELSIDEGAELIATLSLRDHVDDLSALASSLSAPPLLVGHSLGGLIAQLVAARIDHAGVVAACPSPVGSAGLNRTTMAISLPYARQPRPWAKPVHPPSWELFRRGVAHQQSDADAHAAYDDLVCESGRILFFELAAPWLDRARAAKVDYGATTRPVLVVGAELDRIVPPRTVLRAAGRFTNASHVQVPASDHFILAGAALPITMGLIDEWITRKNVFA